MPAHPAPHTLEKRCLVVLVILTLVQGGCELPGRSPAGQANAPAPTTLPIPFPAQPTPLAGQLQPAFPITLPVGFNISVYARNLTAPRMLAIGPDGQLYVAERGAGRILRLSEHTGGSEVRVVADHLNAPSSLAFFRDGSLYVGETTRILRLDKPDAQGIFQERQVIIDGLPLGGHSTRTVLFSPDWATLFVSVGSSCNVCQETDGRRAAVVSYTPGGQNEQVFARGLRNAVGLTFRPGTDELWATNNGRDLLGDDLPPDTINLVRPGNDFGWPRCHAGRIVDPEFGGETACQGVTPPAVELQAHSAPLGLEFYTGAQFPPEYRGGLFVAFHGSWNRSQPTGYKVVFIPFKDGRPGPQQDFATGWLKADGTAWGRPVGLVTAPDGSLFLSDDGSGVIYRIVYTGG